ncbi:hypothetical protein ACOSQ3_015994 [Xanthoceras sorbifolium]
MAMPPLKEDLEGTKSSATGRAKEHRVRGRAEVLFGVEEGPEVGLAKGLYFLPLRGSTLASEDRGRLVFLG